MSTSYVGQLLVASPSMVDPLFGRSVCLVVQHDEDGAIGVLLNRPLEVAGGNLWQALGGGEVSPGSKGPGSVDAGSVDAGSGYSASGYSASGQQLSGQGQNRLSGHMDAAKANTGGETTSDLSSGKPGRCVHFGGPLSGPVLALHGVKTLAEAETASGIYLAAEKTLLQQLVNSETQLPVRLIVGHAAWQSGQLEAEVAAGFWYVLPATADRVFTADDAMWPELVRTGVGHALARWVGIDDTQVDPQLN